MKTKIKYQIKKVMMAVALIIICQAISWAQNEQATDKKASSIQLSFYKKGDQSKYAMVLVNTKNQKMKFVPAPGAEVSFYILNGKEEMPFGKVTTGADGKASQVLPVEMPLNSERRFTLIAKIENDKKYENAREELSIIESNMVIKLNPVDTGRTVTAAVTEMNKDGKDVPVKNVPINLYVTRLFGTMPIGEDHTANTDDNGEAIFTLPKNIKGDTAGNITLVAKIEDNDQLGNVEALSTVAWGVPLVAEADPFPRALWQPRAPAPLIITISTIFICIWGIYFFLFYQMFKISGDAESDKSMKMPASS